MLKKRLFLPVADTGPSGVLSFPAGIEGSDLLAGASQLTLSLRDVDAAERAFTWNVK